LHSVALVTAPALPMPAIADAAAQNLANKEAPLNLLPRRSALRRAPTRPACRAAIATLRNGRVDKTLCNQAVANLAALEAQLDQRTAAERKAKVDGVLEAALAAKKILPAQGDA
jgi:hypothetical protein